MFKNLGPGAIGVKANLPESLALAKKFGFQGVDFSITEAQGLVEQQGVDAVRQMFADAGLIPGSFGFPVEFRKDTATWEAGLQALPKQAALAQKLGCLRTATWIMPASDEMDFWTYYHHLTQRLRPAAQILQEYGIRFGLEFIGPKTLRDPRKYTFVHTMDGMLALCGHIGENMGLLLDIYHLYTSHGHIDDIGKTLRKEDVVVVHLNDSQPGPIDELQDLVRALPLETGILDVAGFLRAVNDLGYDGPVTIEPFSQRLKAMAPEDAVRETGAAMDKSWLAAGLV